MGRSRGKRHPATDPPFRSIVQSLDRPRGGGQSCLLCSAGGRLASGNVGRPFDSGRSRWFAGSRFRACIVRVASERLIRVADGGGAHGMIGFRSIVFTAASLPLLFSRRYFATMAGGQCTPY